MLFAITKKDVISDLNKVVDRTSTTDKFLQLQTWHTFCIILFTVIYSAKHTQYLLDVGVSPKYTVLIEIEDVTIKKLALQIF